MGSSLSIGTFHIVEKITFESRLPEGSSILRVCRTVCTFLYLALHTRFVSKLLENSVGNFSQY